MSWNRASTWCTAVLSMPDCGGGAQGGTRERGLGLLLSGRGDERHHDSAWGAGVGAHRLLTAGPGRFAFRATFWRYMSASAAAIRSSGAVVSLERVAMPALKLRCNSSPCQGKRVCSIKSRIDWRTIADPSAPVWGRIAANSSPPRRADIRRPAAGFEKLGDRLEGFVPGVVPFRVVKNFNQFKAIIHKETIP